MMASNTTAKEQAQARTIQTPMVPSYVMVPSVVPMVIRSSDDVYEMDTDEEDQVSMFPGSTREQKQARAPSSQTTMVPLSVPMAITSSDAAIMKGRGRPKSNDVWEKRLAELRLFIKENGHSQVKYNENKKNWRCG